ncbi:DNA polymerase III subunit gamma/tau [Roseobacter sp. HKCCD9010]|uniref:DNA polymerase III subunit gamma/tau n=1 Tax=unclassified Roseobacter TaxID=196798 RepID=UPI001491A30F|nr:MULTISPECIES: DNA polymerase III subunit gamma/tau [unclassified Roseobacter]MBF9048735.1 DNA polymerase III subunit gamma/tau [Rhodobacterales bacterium HKCCD4356]NNV10734.1 DNA polymerase III subunit gamma/tau [Roseobacter sp. HKCCD7357]NNV14919.1 DNA polymerase III subunit gamma/tau [Roseobacter sp. HKCCD8768]NNV24378.1 DNA polymerase III subunit gamma/tau [Roseobacter sp. HKCCD8192]NNV28635.1 DNA polymerase III subunit gamma/tau [Roseobacter sp. HKCCD9061]
MTDTQDTGYQVLARKYRPASFADLIGQDAMVRTLKNAFAADRIAQAFILTGIRGTGKTTTARIIAKGLNCVGPDGEGGPTTEPCGQCEPCQAIAEGRHVDVLEMDAASRTGVGDIREIIDSVHYRAASARYKIYIIDEVHMLSTSAFNALLKTLEEPPAHVKFIFATTEIRKVPVTVLSRCQRFDLRRIEPEVMIAHLSSIAGKENAEISEDALALITRAAEGSVRDAMSLMDQAISHGAGETTVDQVRAMLGLADRGRVLDLFEMIMSGDAAGALNELGAQYADGADPMAVLRDLAEITHWLSVIKITPEAVNDPTISPDERSRGQGLAEKLPMRVLSRMWQMLLKALEEVALAPNPMMAAEMAVIRLTHVADLPSPEDLLRKLSNTPAPAPSAATQSTPAPSGAPTGPQAQSRSGPTARGGAQPAVAEMSETALAHYPTFQSVVALIEANRDIKLLVEVKTTLRLVSYQPGRIEFEPTERAPADLAQRLGQSLKGWTGVRWAVSVVAEGGGETIEEQQNADLAALKAEAEAHPMMQAVIAAFPSAKITEIRTREEIAAEAAIEALPEVDDEWDPFEDD